MQEFIKRKRQTVLSPSKTKSKDLVGSKKISLVSPSWIFLIESIKYKKEYFDILKAKMSLNF
jgi:hypothetical protein